MNQTKKGLTWCDHCGVDLKTTSIQSCLRKTCLTKDLLRQAEKLQD